MLAKVDEKLMLLEEEGVKEGKIIPEEKRWRVMKVEADLQRKWIRISLLKGAIDDEGCGTVKRSRRMFALLGEYTGLLYIMLDDR